MISSLGATVVVCAALGGETGRVLMHLVEDTSIELAAFEVAGRNGAYVHDRRDGDRTPMVEMRADPLTRHELDDLYETTLVRALRASTAVLSGPAHDGVVPESLYRRLASDLTGNGCRVLVDLSGDRLRAALEAARPS